jgi:hypothetical protein
MSAQLFSAARQMRLRSHAVLASPGMAASEYTSAGHDACPSLSKTTGLYELFLRMINGPRELCAGSALSKKRSGEHVHPAPSDL